MTVRADMIGSPIAPSDGSAVEQAIDDIAAGHPVIVVDDRDRENEADLIFAGAHSTPERMAFMIRYTSGLVCAPMPGDDLDRLELPAMVADNTDPKRTAYAISIDAAHGVGTGISAADRSCTVRALADPATRAGDLTRPGHILPLRAHPNGVLERRGHTEAAVDLVRLAGIAPVGVIAELVNDDGTMMRGDRLAVFARTHGLTMISVAQLADFRYRHETLLHRVAVTRLPTGFGTFAAYAYRSVITGAEHVALVCGTPDPDAAILTRVHSECLTGDAFGSVRCDCGAQLTEAMTRIAAHGGVLIYLRGHEGRGIGLAPKLRAYQLQESGRDTVEANLDLGLPVDARSYHEAAQILRDLDVRTVRLLTNNPGKQRDLERGGITVVDRIGTTTVAGPDNIDYLRTKRDRMGHLLTDLDQHVTLHHDRPGAS